MSRSGTRSTTTSWLCRARSSNSSRERRCGLSSPRSIRRQPTISSRRIRRKLPAIIQCVLTGLCCCDFRGILLSRQDNPKSRRILITWPK
jgi:hypothetical protein